MPIDPNHPLAGRNGEGPPIAPVGWKWAAGWRRTDVYFFTPAGQKFRSRSQLESYLARTPGSPSPSEFRWRVSLREFKHGLPGTPSIDTGVNRHVKDCPKKKWMGKTRKTVDAFRTRKLEISGPRLVKDSPLRFKKPKIVDGDFLSSCHYKFGKGNINESRRKLLAASFEKWSAENTQVLQNLFVDAGYFKEVNDVTMEELRRLLFIGVLSSDDLKSFPDNVLQMCALLLRDEDVPVSASSDCLVELCINWNCKHKHPWCLLEAGRVQSFLNQSKTELKSQVHKSSSGHDGLDLTSGNSSFVDFLDVSAEQKNGLAVDEFQIHELLSIEDLNGSDLQNMSLGTIEAVSSGKDELDLHTHEVPSFEMSVQNVGIKGDMESIPQNTRSLEQNQVMQALIEGESLEHKQAQLEGLNELLSHLVEVKENKHTYDLKMEQVKRFTIGECPQTKTEGVEGTLESMTIQNQGLTPGSEAEALNLENGVEVKIDDQVEPLHFECPEGTRCMPLNSNEDCVIDVDVKQLNKDDKKIQNSETVKASMDTEGKGKRKRKKLWSSKRPEKVAKKKKRARATESKTIEVLDKHQGFVGEANMCTCKTCQENANFCRGCTCSVCMVIIQPEDFCSYITCSCFHVLHLKCAVKRRFAGVVNVRRLDGEFLCPSCHQRKSLISFCRDMVVYALTTANLSTLKEHLSAVNLVLKGTQKPSQQAIQEKVAQAHRIAADSSFPYLQHLLLSLKDQLNMLQVQQHETGLVTKQLAVDGDELDNIDIFEEEAAVMMLQRKEEEELSELQKAKDVMATQMILVDEAQEQLRKAELEVAARTESVRTLHDNTEKAKMRVESLQQHCRSKGFSKDEIESQRRIIELELSDLKMLQMKIGNLNSLNKDFLSQLQTLLEVQKVQRDRVDSARSRLERMISFKISA